MPLKRQPVQTVRVGHKLTTGMRMIKLTKLLVVQSSPWGHYEAVRSIKCQTEELVYGRSILTPAIIGNTKIWWLKPGLSQFTNGYMWTTKRVTSASSFSTLSGKPVTLGCLQVTGPRNVSCCLSLQVPASAAN
ncbi:hypothetical protein RRG08_056353 [Elysia crispata]|uniref:Uncharacterized protein n=1 Tax=Elysia crispata TaxID=231223 RepID=A0AAE0YPE7_9GAST|nr:hypothetical protein RRG08_056353 [Elysia crispata]